MTCGRSVLPPVASRTGCVEGEEGCSDREREREWGVLRGWREGEWGGGQGGRVRQGESG